MIFVTDRGWNTTQIRDYGFVTAAYVPVSDLFFKNNVVLEQAIDL